MTPANHESLKQSGHGLEYPNHLLKRIRRCRDLTDVRVRKLKDQKKVHGKYG
ncbi:MAG: hypothetical protein K0R68_1850, partial [Mycobacterium sp.]|nr:hypothetical protein [Mycobacterium sp.]